MINFYNILLVALGGALGSVARYLSIEITNAHNHGSNFPLGTILVNIIGSFIMGILHYLFTQYFDSISLQTRLFLMVGILGGFTTFSAFSIDTFRLVMAGQNMVAISYILSSVLLSIAAIFLGFYLTKLAFNF